MRLQLGERRYSSKRESLQRFQTKYTCKRVAMCPRHSCWAARTVVPAAGPRLGSFRKPTFFSSSASTVFVIRVPWRTAWLLNLLRRLLSLAAQSESTRLCRPAAVRDHRAGRCPKLSRDIKVPEMPPQTFGTSRVGRTPTVNQASLLKRLEPHPGRHK